jgi:hypothetical protein
MESNKKNKSKIVAMALAGALTGGVGLLSADSAHAKHTCKGISMKWVNGCEANGHSCEFKAEKDWDPNEWLATKDEAECNKIKAALKDDVIKNYIVKIRDTTVTAAKRGKKF